MSSLRWRVRCVESHTVSIPADKMVDARSGAVLCDVPARDIFYSAGHTAGFRTKKDRDAFLKAATAGKWEAA